MSQSTNFKNEVSTSVSDCVHRYIDVDLNFPKHISSVLEMSIPGLFQNSCLSVEKIEDMKKHFVALVHFKAAEQLYYMMSVPGKSKLNKLTNIINNMDFDIPVSIAQSIQIIGHFDAADHVKIITKDAPYVFQNWVWKGGFNEFSRLPIWKDDVSYDYLTSKVSTLMEQLCDSPLSIEIKREAMTTNILVKLVPFDKEKDFKEVCSAYEMSKDKDLLIACATFLRMSKEQFNNGRPIPDLLVEKFNIDIQHSKPNYLFGLFHNICYRWVNQYRELFEKYVKCGPAPATTRGTT